MRTRSIKHVFPILVLLVLGQVVNGFPVVLGQVGGVSGAPQTAVYSPPDSAEIQAGELREPAADRVHVFTGRKIKPSGVEGCPGPISNSEDPECTGSDYDHGYPGPSGRTLNVEVGGPRSNSARQVIAIEQLETLEKGLPESFKQPDPTDPTAPDIEVKIREPVVAQLGKGPGYLITIGTQIVLPLSTPAGGSLVSRSANCVTPLPMMAVCSTYSVGQVAVDVKAGNDSVFFSETGDTRASYAKVNPGTDGSDPDASFETNQRIPITVFGGSGNDLIRTGNGDDNVYGEQGDENRLFDPEDPSFGRGIQAGSGNDRVHSGSGTDVIDGEEDDDALHSGDGTDVIQGGDGNDKLDGGSGPDEMIGGEGSDTVDYSLRASVVVASLPEPGGTSNGNGETALGENDTIFGDVENLIGGSKDDQLTGNSIANQLEGRLGNDTLKGRSGGDIIFGAGGGLAEPAGVPQDVIFGGAGDDLLYGMDDERSPTRTGVGCDVVFTFRTDGHDTIHGDGDGSTADGNDTMEGGAGQDTMYGNGGNDIMYGRDSLGETFEGGGDPPCEPFVVDRPDGNDDLRGGTGNDKLVGDRGDDDYCNGAPGIDEENIATCEGPDL